jgi:hypothetical protein
MVPAPSQFPEPENPDVLGVRAPSRTTTAVVALALVDAAHLAGFQPEGPAAGAVLAAAACGFMAKECIRRRR